MIHTASITILTPSGGLCIALTSTTSFLFNCFKLATAASCKVVVVLPPFHTFHFRSGQLTYPHCSWASLLCSLPVLTAQSFTNNWQLPFLNQRKGENGRRNYFMINLHERMWQMLGWCLKMSLVMRKPVFGVFQPGKTQTGLLSYRD